VFPRIAYLRFADRWFGQVRYDLATSGVSPVTAAELGAAAPDDRGSRERYVTEISARYGVDASEILPCVGASGALFVVYAALLDEGSLLVEDPAYEPLWRAADALGARVDRFQREATRVDPEVVIRALRPDTRIVAITNPHNPSGGVLDDAALLELAGSLQVHGVWLLVDEAYLELVLPAHTARRLAPNVITCSSVTKCLGVPWARAGWLLLPAELAEAAARINLYTVGVPPPSCWAWGERALVGADALLERAHRLQSGKRAVVDAFAAQHANFLSWAAPPEAGCFGWFSDARGRHLTALIERGIESAGVVVSPGEFFGDPRAFRLSWTAPREVVIAGLQELSEVLELR
jgi:aspartate/methionine/tyrosine aminotransferase